MAFRDYSIRARMGRMGGPSQPGHIPTGAYPVSGTVGLSLQLPLENGKMEILFNIGNLQLRNLPHARPDVHF